jgi:hypothetical protein
LLSRRKYVALQFLCAAMQTDTEAPKYGTHTLENFFKELNASHKSYNGAVHGNGNAALRNK